MRRVFISDCEGPISRNDNAFELTSHFVPDGNRLFAIISRYDDVLADVLRRPGHRAGSTLKLILPFLASYGVTDQIMREFSSAHLVLVPDVKLSLQHTSRMSHSFIVSTSYEHYMRVLCGVVGFSFENTYCTRLRLDEYAVPTGEKRRVRKIAEEIVKMPTIEIPAGAASLESLSKGDVESIWRLDDVFREEIGSMEIGRTYSDITPIGGAEKAGAVADIVHKTGSALSDLMYVGDSITDVEAFKLVKENGGLTVSFNGNEYAIRNAEIAVLSETALVTSILADLFCKSGKDQTLEIAGNWGRETLIRSPADKELVSLFFSSARRKVPEVKIITRENMEDLADESGSIRKSFRGEIIGGLG